jgi:hypothetical protein
MLHLRPRSRIHAAEMHVRNHLTRALDGEGRGKGDRVSEGGGGYDR